MRSESPSFPSDAPPKSSPSKRKRSISDPTIHPFAPRLRDEITAGDIYTDAQLAGASSPRSIIADRLSELDLQAPLPPIRFRGAFERQNGNGDMMKRPKKVKFSRLAIGDEAREGGGLTAIEESGSDGDGDDNSVDGLKPLPKQRRLKSPPPPGTDKTEIPETPQPQRLSAVSPPESSPSPPSSSSSSNNELKTVKDAEQASDTGSATSQQTTMKESADHESLEALDPDDDGTGINGIGFRPTPAMAWQRMQKRKQQVSDWRAREAKEARQKRSERRNKAAAIMAVDSDMANTRRTVRFAS